MKNIAPDFPQKEIETKATDLSEDVLRDVIKQAHDMRSDTFEIPWAYSGLCSYLQSAIGYTLQDLGFTVRPFAMKSVNDE